ncbi:hypothetical protein M8818_003592 [Zalaria obscura]|uniref:Uncharacterized protein n=1 Tax=Zalaria obscura TaxID=2024903 RepID=A0ACC3SI52_9PEZI
MLFVPFQPAQSDLGVALVEQHYAEGIVAVKHREGLGAEMAGYEGQGRLGCGVCVAGSGDYAEGGAMGDESKLVDLLAEFDGESEECHIVVSRALQDRGGPSTMRKWPHLVACGTIDAARDEFREEDQCDLLL